MRLLMAGSQRKLHIKDALSRIVVEMIKREWPQQWPTLLAELNMASVQGTSQAEIVLLIFLRLSEDVALLQVLIVFKSYSLYCNFHDLVDKFII